MVPQEETQRNNFRLNLILLHLEQQQLIHFDANYLKSILRYLSSSQWEKILVYIMINDFNFTQFFIVTIHYIFSELKFILAIFSLFIQKNQQDSLIFKV